MADRDEATDRPPPGSSLARWLEAMPVRDWMKREVVTIPPEASVADAARLMKERRIRHLPVVDAGGHLVGVITDRDLRQVIFDPDLEKELGHSLAALRSRPVGRVMTASVVTVRPETDMRQAARLMHERKIGALPVVGDGAVVGVLTESDVLAAFREVLRTRVVGTRPLRDAPTAEAYDYGFPVPEVGDLWQTDAAQD
jgi:acetoin utilization protein AcuB